MYEIKEFEEGGSQVINGDKASDKNAKQEFACLNTQDSGLAGELAESVHVDNVTLRLGLQIDPSETGEILWTGQLLWLRLITLPMSCSSAEKEKI